MAVNIFEVKPNVVSKDLRGYSMLIYGGPKVGKTTFATRAEKHLLLAFEKGYAALPNVMALPMNSWAEFKSVIQQLTRAKRDYDIAKSKDPNTEPPYEVIIIDIVDIAWEYCEKYVLAKHGVEKIGDIPFGQGYGLVAVEFDTALRSIVQQDYGLIMISHANYIPDPDNEKSVSAAPTLAKRPKNITTRLVDIYGYISQDETEDGIVHVMHLRKTSEWDAGTRFRYMPETIKLGYPEMVEAIGEAIDKEAAETGTVPTEKHTNNYAVKDVSFDDEFSKAQALINSIMEKSTNPDNSAMKVQAVIEKNLGPNNKLSDITPAQIEQLQVIIEELREVS